ncbi:MAG: hypothetical protein WB797_01805 [Nocardioides sp.]
MKPVHGVVALVLAVVWFGTLGFVLTHGHGGQSSVDVYSELPPGFDAQIRAQGVTYQGLSSVDATTQKAVESLPSPSDAAVTGAAPLVLRTSFTDLGKPQGGGPSYTDHPALMVVLDAAGARAGGEIWVEFVDPTTYRVLRTVKYAASPSSAPSSSG